MIIPVKCSCGGECKEWGMVELQGSVEIQRNVTANNLTIGSLCRSSAKTYKLVIGYHELEGTKVTLTKPLVLLKKVKTNDEGAGEEATEMDIRDAAAAATPATSSVEMHVVGIIRHKLLFKGRPKALISKVEVKPKKPRALPSPRIATE